jgi:hypothetical protein
MSDIQKLDNGFNDLEPNEDDMDNESTLLTDDDLDEESVNINDDYSSEDETNDNEIENEQIKKKRGRKCKPKDESSISEKVQKKRGRKPKVKSNEVDDEKIPKKRGRKPKEKIYSVKELPKTFFEENKQEPLILHLPITSYDKTNNNPEPNSNDVLGYSIYDNLSNNNFTMDLNDSSSNILPTQMNFMDFNNKNVFKNNEIMNDIKENDNSKKDNIEDDYKINRVVKKNLKNIMYEFINANNDKVWPETTSIYCWWCCHPFNWMPCALPEYYKKDKFYVNGCFCSFNCTASYNFSKCDDDIWERYSLLNLMYKKLYNTKFIKVNLAPPREILKIFGGYMTIDEFRENSLKNEKVFTVINPPLISIIPKIEENVSNSYKANIKGNISLVNENILNKTQNSLKLKRNKPVTNPNSTLQSFMDLKII